MMMRPDRVALSIAFMMANFESARISSRAFGPALLTGVDGGRMLVATVLWRRLNAPGHDACRLSQTQTGWRLDGAAVFQHQGAPTYLSYVVATDRKWRTRKGEVRGWIGGRPLNQYVTRTVGGIWRLNGKIAPALGGCVDLDFGFTPATNLLQLRRLALPIGQVADVPVAWLDAATGVFDKLDQHYKRCTAELYSYEAPRFGYSEFLRVSESGFVVNYPKLWEAEPLGI